MRRAGRWLVCVLGLALVLAACGGGSSSGEAKKGSTAATDDGRSDAQVAQDQAAASAALLSISDLPTGWQGKPSDADTAGPGIASDLAVCLKVDPTMFDKGRTRAKSDTFSKNDAEVQVGLTVQPTLDRAKAAMTAVSQPAARSCFQSVVRKIITDNLLHPAKGEGLPSGVEIKDVTVGNLSFPAMGEESTAYRMTVSVVGKGLSVDLFLDIVYARVGRATGAITFQNALTEFDSALAQKLTTKFVSRLPAT